VSPKARVLGGVHAVTVRMWNLKWLELEVVGLAGRSLGHWGVPLKVVLLGPYVGLPKAVCFKSESGSDFALLLLVWQCDLSSLASCPCLFFQQSRHQSPPDVSTVPLNPSQQS
jgi:hypothetical protein